MSEDNRAYPRFRIGLPVTALGFEFTTTNLSLSGAQIACSESIYKLISGKLDSRELRLTLHLTQSAIDLTARIPYVSSYGEESLIGLQFQAFENDGHELLKAFIVERKGEDFVRLAPPAS